MVYGPDLAVFEKLRVMALLLRDRLHPGIRPDSVRANPESGAATPHLRGNVDPRVSVDFPLFPDSHRGLLSGLLVSSGHRNRALPVLPATTEG